MAPGGGSLRMPDQGVGTVVANQVVADDVRDNGIGPGLKKVTGPAETSAMLAGFPAALAILSAAVMLALGAAVALLLIPGPSNAATQPDGPVAVERLGAAQPAPRLKIASGSIVDVSYSNPTNPTCPKPFEIPPFGAGYGMVLNPDGSITFTPGPNSQFAPPLTGKTTDTAVTAEGVNNIYKLNLTANFNQLNLPTRLDGTALITLDNPAGGTCQATVQVAGKINEGSAITAPPPPKLAGVPDAGQLAAGSGGSGGVSWPLPVLGAGVALLVAGAAVGGWRGRERMSAPVSEVHYMVSYPPATRTCQTERTALEAAEANLAQSAAVLEEFEVLRGGANSPMAEARRKIYPVLDDWEESDAVEAVLSRGDPAGFGSSKLGDRLAQIVDADRATVDAARAELDRCMAEESFPTSPASDRQEIE